jgi:hypothetical protein
MGVSKPKRWWQVIWYVGDKSTYRKMYWRIFGRATRAGGRLYRYDGILEGWKGDKKVILIPYLRLKNGSYAIPDEALGPIRDVLDELDVDYRFMPYYPEENRVVKGKGKTSFCYDFVTKAERLEEAPQTKEVIRKNG